MPNLGAIICVAKVDLSPKPLSNTIWTVTCYMAFMNVIMKVINKQLGIIWDDHERCKHLTFHLSYLEIQFIPSAAATLVVSLFHTGVTRVQSAKAHSAAIKEA